MEKMSIEDILIIIRMINADFHYTTLNSLVITKLFNQKEFIENLLIQNDYYYFYNDLFDELYIIEKKEI